MFKVPPSDLDVNDVSVVILGAGFSAAATDGKAPLMTGFFDCLDRHEFPDLYEFVREVGCSKKCSEIRLANLEKVLLALEQFRSSPEHLLKHWFGTRKHNLDVIEEQLSFYVLYRLRECLEISGDNWAANFLANCGEETTVISMNYDNIAERILSCRDGLRHGRRSPTCPHCKMRLLLDAACSCGFRNEELGDDWRGAVIKPHGSISWRRCTNAECCTYQCLVADQHCRPFEPCDCPNCGESCAPALVLPTMSKSLHRLPEIGTMWHAARLALQEAETILLFGFSVPTSDELFVQLIRSSCERGRKLKRVASIDLDPASVLDRFQACLPAECEVELKSFPVVIGERPEWLRVKPTAVS